MAFFNRLQQETDNERQYLLQAPIIQRCMAKQLSLDDYVAFLQQAYHHVKHTTPLLMTAGGRLPASKEWLRNAVAEYIKEELGHQEWVLNDIAACGFDKEQARHSQPNFSTELMVAYAYDAINRQSPLCFFGMVHVLEGTSTALASTAADAIAETLSLPKNAFSYLYSHGALDIEHVAFFEQLMNKIVDEDEQALIINSAKAFYRLYGNVFRELSPDHGLTAHKPEAA
jgi:pyrroloquinoline quinone (PQQ) biosynthesis protein C